MLLLVQTLKPPGAPQPNRAVLLVSMLPVAIMVLNVKNEKTTSVEIIYKNRTRLFASLSAGTKVLKFFEY